MVVLYGRRYILAMAKYGEQLARQLECPCTILEGVHFVTRECGPEIYLLLKHQGQRIHNNPHKYLDQVPDPWSSRTKVLQSKL